MRPWLLLLPILASTLQLQSTTGDAATTDTGCQRPATCGNLTISYPFWLGNQTTPSCGPPAFQLNCNTAASPSAFLTTSYIRVLDIDYATRSLVAVHVNVAADAACSVLFNVSSAFAITDRFRISPSNRVLYVLYSCDGNRTPPGAVPVTNCSANNTQNFAYLGGSYGTSRPPANDGRCEITELPVLGSEAEGATADSYKRLIRAGFRLEWEPVGDCNACSASGGRCRYDGNTAAFACLCSDGSLRASTCDGKHKRKLSLIVTLSAVAGFAFICLPWLMYRHKRKITSLVYPFYSTDTSSEEEVLRKCGSLAPKRFKYSELKKITKSFKEELGQGGCGVVFRGRLRDGRMVAVKLLKGINGNGQDFLNEVVSISQTSHVNIVSLLGFCLEGSKRALVYEYMPNGSLQNHIYSDQVVKWETLLRVAVGVARGLEYLHQGCNARIIHFDIKPHNILLDEGFCPKIADFGLAKLCHLNDSILSTAEARGTVGFIAPEVFSRGFGVVSTKSDVYSYGMVLLEMVRGRSGVRQVPDDDSSSETFFPHLVYDHLVRATYNYQIAHTSTEEIARKLTMVGLWCIQMTPENRPSMSRVVEMLERKVDELEMPPKPFLCSPPQSTNVSSYNSFVVMMPS